MSERDPHTPRSLPAELAGPLPRRIAHALRTPLGLVASALHELDPGDDPLAALGRRGVQQLGLLADRLGLLGRLTTSAADREPGTVELAQTLRQAVDEVARTRPRRRVQTTVAELPARVQVRGDAEQLRSAMRELVDNATRVAARSVEVSLAIEAGHARLRVLDDGPGPDSTPTPSSGGAGLGLGLFLVRAVCERHGASFELRPGPEGGALALLSVPVERA